MTKPDLDAMLERLVKNLDEIDNESRADAYGWYAQSITAICAVLREKSYEDGR